MQAPRWTYSSISNFEKCPRQYQSKYVTKEVKYTETEATRYGTEAHLAAEEYIRDGKPLPPAFGFLQSNLDALKAIPGDKYCELKLAIKLSVGQYVEAEFDDAEATMRGIADLVIIDNDKAYIVDYKTGKSSRYADSRQIALMAACIFAKFPNVQQVKGALLFVVIGEMIKSSYQRESAYAIFAELDRTLKRREAAYGTGIFNPIPNALCAKWCQTDCPHNGSL